MENGYYDQINFWETAEQDFFPYIKEIELLSGEPFIQKDTYRLIETISKINPSCTWSFTTNAHWQLTNKITDFLDRIDIRDIIISIDSLVPERYAEIRRGGNLEVVLKTTRDIIAYNQKRSEKGQKEFTITLHFLVMKNNWEELPLVYQFVKEHNIKLTLNNIVGPIELALDQLPEEERLNIIEQVALQNNKDALLSFHCFFNSLISKMSPLNQASALLTIKEHLI
jgi:cyclic pyranopterin phosphate synthase